MLASSAAVVRRLVPVVLAVLVALPASAREFRLVRTVGGKFGGGPFAVLGTDVVVPVSGGAERVDTTTGAVVRTYPGDAGSLPSVAALGDTIFLGDVLPPGQSSGRVRAYDATTAAPKLTIESPAPNGRDFFGAALVAVGTSLYVGAPFAEVGGPAAGAVFELDAATGALVRTLTGPARAEGDAFGATLVLDGANLLIGAAGHAPGGAAYVFARATGQPTLTLENPVAAEQIEPGRRFAAGIARIGAAIAVSAPEVRTNDLNGAVFLLDGTSGALVRTLPAPYLGEFGAALVAAGDSIVIAAPSHNTIYAGRVFVADPATTAYTQVLERPAPSVGVGPTSDYGYGAALAGSRLVIVASGQQGALHVYADTTNCGDGMLDADEVCDDGNRVDGDGCDRNCRPSGCGNGEAVPPEQCDDANDVDGDGCDHNCTITSCGNGVVTAGEECDDGNEDDGDGCSGECRTEPVTTTTRPSVTTTTQPVGCTAASCDDGDPCTEDACTGVDCVHADVRGAATATCLVDGIGARTQHCDPLVVPAALSGRLAVARALVVQGVGRPAPRLLKKADQALAQAVALLRRAHGVPAACTSELGQVVDAVRVKVRGLR